jgi:uncharacterized membrane protein
MLFNRFAKRAVTVATLGAAAAAVAVVPAHAAEGTWSVISSSNCQAKEIIRLQPVGGVLHDFMLVDPTVNIGTCLFEIWNNNTSMPAYSSESGEESQPVFDGPGQSLKVRVFTWKDRVGWFDEADGPSN